MITATEAVRPTVEKFAAECLVSTDDCNDYITGKNLYSIFKQWCKKNQCRNCSPLIFTKNMDKVPAGAIHERQREPGKWKTQNAVSMYRFVKVKGTQP